MLSSWDRAGRPSVRATTTTTRMSCECGATHDGARRNACAVSKSSRKGEWQHTRSIDTHAATQRPRERGWRGAMAAAATDEMPAMAGKRRYAGGCHRGSGGTVRSGLLMAHQGMASKMVCACVWIWRGVKTGPPDPPKCAARHRLSGPGVLHVERAQHPPPPPRRPRRCIHTDTHTHTRERWRRRTHTPAATTTTTTTRRGSARKMAATEATPRNGGGQMAKAHPPPAKVATPALAVASCSPVAPSGGRWYRSVARVSAVATPRPVGGGVAPKRLTHRHLCPATQRESRLDQTPNRRHFLDSQPLGRRK